MILWYYNMLLLDQVISGQSNQVTTITIYLKYIINVLKILNYTHELTDSTY